MEILCLKFIATSWLTMLLLELPLPVNKCHVVQQTLHNKKGVKCTRILFCSYHVENVFPKHLLMQNGS